MWSAKKTESRPVRYWEIIARNLKKRGWSLGWVSAIDSNGRTIWIADAHRGDGTRFVLRADERLTAFVGFESAIRAGVLWLFKPVEEQRQSGRSVSAGFAHFFFVLF
jgi:hypothetical protein